MVQGNSMTRVAFWFDAPIAYSGGLNYISNLLYALSLVNDQRVAPYVFFAADVPDAIVQRFERYATVVRTRILQRKTLPWLIHKLNYKINNSMFLVDRLLKTHQIEVLSHLWLPYVGRRQFKIISWIPDFQYLHLPEMFPGIDEHKESEIKRRIATNADAVVVSSEHALGDLQRVVPKDQLPHVEVLRFVSQPEISPGVQLPTLAQLQDKYQFSGKFFLLPNQFWAHKNHEVVLRAIAEAKRSGISMTVLFTGNTKDYRLAGTPYLDGLKKIIEENGIKMEARILGMIDYADLLALMRHCVGFINPSRFEGWSSSVEEAKSVGKPILMSRIPVHVEQAPAHGAYFDCDDVATLRVLMCELWNRHDSVDQEKNKRDAQNELQRRTTEFGETYVRILMRVASKVQ